MTTPNGLQNQGKSVCPTTQAATPTNTPTTVPANATQTPTSTSTSTTTPTLVPGQPGQFLVTPDATSTPTPSPPPSGGGGQRGQFAATATPAGAGSGTSGGSVASQERWEVAGRGASAWNCAPTGKWIVRRLSVPPVQFKACVAVTSALETKSGADTEPPMMSMSRLFNVPLRRFRRPQRQANCAQAAPDVQGAAFDGHL